VISLTRSDNLTRRAALTIKDIASELCKGAVIINYRSLKFHFLEAIPKDFERESKINLSKTAKHSRGKKKQRDKEKSK
jgi:hypothetical protein